MSPHEPRERQHRGESRNPRQPSTTQDSWDNVGSFCTVPGGHDGGTSAHSLRSQHPLRGVDRGWVEGGWRACKTHDSP